MVGSISKENTIASAFCVDSGLISDRMYNLLVTARSGAWDLPGYEFDRSRFGEYTAESLIARFNPLTPSNIDELRSFPTVFAYEGLNEITRIGYIRDVKERTRTLYVGYEFLDEIPPFPFSILKPHLVALDIGQGEMNRTHWAIKDENLFEILTAAGVANDALLNRNSTSGRVDNIHFKVALSFPGEKRAYVEEIAQELTRRLGIGSVFYDRFFTAQLARPNLDTLLQKIYLVNSDLVVVFLCADYETKEWCGIEWRAIRDIIKNRSDHAVMLMRFDDTRVSGTYSIDGFVDLRAISPIQAARLIVERVRLNDTPP